MRFDTWAEFLEHQRRQPYMRQISEIVTAERRLADLPQPRRRPPAGVYPALEDVFRFTETPLRDVKVVILGQDPYHGPGQADGLAFSVRDPSVCPRCHNHANVKHFCMYGHRDVEKAHTPLPPSLKNIFVELRSDLGVAAGDRCLTVPTNGDLSPWTRQGVLLLNTALTVRRGEAGSHCDIWQPLTDEVIRTVCDSATVAPHFILWGSKARAALMRACDRRLLIDLPDDNGITFTTLRGRRVTFTHSAHPSPLSANKGFFGSRPFSRANTALLLNNPGCAPVDWRLS